MNGRVTALASAMLALPYCASAHVIPDDVTIQAFVKPEGQRLRLLVRLPFNALADVVFPVRRAGDLDPSQTAAMLPDAAKTWISDWVDLYEGETLLPKPQVVETRVSLPSDNSFVSYEQAWATVTGARLPDNMQIFPSQAMLDVIFEYPIHSDRSSFAVHSRLARLGVKVLTSLQFVPPRGAVRNFGYQGDPGLFRLDPLWYQAMQQSVKLGFLQILKGSDYLLFLFCVALLFRRFVALVSFVAAFAMAHSFTLICSAYNLVPDAIWFPVLFETLIAISIVYVALDNIVAATPAQYRWMMGFGFGLVHGFGLSFALRQALQFAGSHALAAVLSFNFGVELGRILVLVAILQVLDLFFRIGVPERIGTIFLAALAAHTGWHRMIDRAKWLSSSQFQWSAISSALLAMAQQWLMISLVLAGLVYLVFGVLRPWWRRSPWRTRFH